MGLISGGNSIFLNIIDGKIALRVKDKTQTSVERVLAQGDNAGQVVHEEYYKGIKGFLVRLERTTHDQYGERLCIYLESDGKMYCLQCDLEGSYSYSFLKALPNADLSKEMELRPFINEENGKKRYVLFIKQGKDTLKFAFTKDKGGMPEPELIKKKGKKDEWNFYPVTEFLIEKVFNPVREKLNKGEQLETVKSESKKTKKKSETPEFPDDDLPF